jgi:hypothetical protein
MQGMNKILQFCGYIGPFGFANARDLDYCIDYAELLVHKKEEIIEKL